MKNVVWGFRYFHPETPNDFLFFLRDEAVLLYSDRQIHILVDRTV